MKAKIGNVELDVVSPDELREILGTAVADYGRRTSPGTARPVAGVKLDGSGNGTVELYKVPAGSEFALHRIMVDADGYTPGAPYTQTAGYADVLRGGHRQDFVAFGNGLPAVGVWSDTGAIRYRHLEVVEIGIVDGPANVAVVVRAQGTLQPLTTS